MLIIIIKFDVKKEVIFVFLKDPADRRRIIGGGHRWWGACLNHECEQREREKGKAIGIQFIIEVEIHENCRI